jgi:hypothetical protein
MSIKALVRSAILSLLVITSILSTHQSVAQADDRVAPSQAVQMHRFQYEQWVLTGFMNDARHQWLYNTPDERVADWQFTKGMFLGNLRTLLGEKWSGKFIKGIPGVPNSSPKDFLYTADACLAAAWMTIDITYGYGDYTTMPILIRANNALQKTGATSKLPK